MGARTIHFTPNCLYIYRNIGGDKVDPKRHGPGVIIERFGGNRSPVYYRGNTTETDLNDLRHTSRIFGICGRGVLAFTFNKYKMTNAVFTRFANISFHIANTERGCT